jgi:hypothetical protein
LPFENCDGAETLLAGGKKELLDGATDELMVGKVPFEKGKGDMLGGVVTLPCMLGRSVTLPCSIGGAVTLLCMLGAAVTLPGMLGGAVALPCMLGRAVKLPNKKPLENCDGNETLLPTGLNELLDGTEP